MIRELSFLTLAVTITHSPLVQARELGDFLLGAEERHVKDEHLPLIRELGLRNTRIELWRNSLAELGRDPSAKKAFLTNINQERDWKVAHLVMLGYGIQGLDHGGRVVSEEGRKAFADYAVSAVLALRPSANLFEIWNEWDVIGMGGCPVEEGHGRVEDYVSLLKETYPAIKKASPDAVVLGGAVAGIGDRRNYLPKALKLGLLDALDGLVIHPYFYGAPDRRERLPENGLTKRLKRVHGWLSKYPKGATVPIYVTEMGWPTCDFGDGVTPEVQAKLMARSILLLAADAQIKGVWIFELKDWATQPSDPGENFGLVDHSLKPKPSFWVMKDLKKVLDDSKSIERMPVKASGSLVMMRLPSKEGGTRWLCWTIQPDTRWKLRITGVGKSGTARVSPLGRFGFPDGWRDEKDGAEIEIGDLPVCIESSSPNLVMESVGPVSSGSPAPTPTSRVSKRSGAASEILPSY